MKYLILLSLFLSVTARFLERGMGRITFPSDDGLILKTTCMQNTHCILAVAWDIQENDKSLLLAVSIRKQGTSGWKRETALGQNRLQMLIVRDEATYDAFIHIKTHLNQAGVRIERNFTVNGKYIFS